MPLMNKKPFKRVKPPKDLKPNEDLFYLQATHEVFREYDDFFERVIMCNSLIWSCELTGKANLTFQEAQKSESEARQSLKSFPSALRKPVLYLARLTAKKRLNDMCDDVFLYAKDRYFIGEEVEVIINGIKKSCEVTQVILPERGAKSPKADTSKLRKSKDVCPTKIKYEVVNYSTGKTNIVKQECMSRPKGSYTKPRNKLFLRHHTEPKDGMWKVKDRVSSKEQLDEYPFEEVFCGPLPAYVETANKLKQSIAQKKNGETPGRRSVQGKLNFKKETEDDRRKNVNKQALMEKQRLAAERERQKEKKQLEDEKEKQRMDKINERLKRKEEKRKMAEYLSTWKKPREDLECDDLKDLPVATPIECGIPHNCFGDALMVLEFLNTFDKQIQIKDVFPHGITFEHIEKALMDSDIQGVLNDLLQLFLTVIFRYQEAEDDIDFKDKSGFDIPDLDTLDIDQATDIAMNVVTWPQKYHGTILRNIPMDSFSLTEILRLHILASGSKRRISWQGIVTPSEDPGLYFKLEEPTLLKKLAEQSVFELNCEERCKILCLLMNQLLACDVFRCALEENIDKTQTLRLQLKNLRIANSRKGKEDSQGKKLIVINEGKSEGNEDQKSETAVDDEEKENTKNLSLEEKAELEEKKVKDLANQKAEFQRKEKEIELKIAKLQSSFNLSPLGRDRSYRRYWIFQSVAGLFVEDEDSFKGPCLDEKTKQVLSPSVTFMKTESTLIKYLQQMDDNKSASSDKENDILKDIAMVQSGLPFPVKNRKLSDLNPRVDSKKGSIEDDRTLVDEVCLQCKTKSEIDDDRTWYCPHSKSQLPLDQCSADIDTCPIHNLSVPRTHWSFYYKEDDLDNLISSLNIRGFREKSLRDVLVSEKEKIKELMERSPFYVYNRTIPAPLLPEVRKSQRHQNALNSSYAGMSPRFANESTLRDMILELEVRIYAGGLGSLKVENRDTWRSSLERGSVDLSVNEVVKSEQDNNEEEIKCETPITLNPVEITVKELAVALLQVSQGIEARYLNSPLGESVESKKAKLKNPDKVDKKKCPVSSLDRWQDSLQHCTSISQLFMHLGTLERSVAWSRSVLKAHCRICRRRGDPENMLLCDGCNRGHHVYCLKPPLESIPEDDWFCTSCRPIEVPLSPTKLKNTESESNDEDEDSEENEDEEEDEDEEDEEEEMDHENGEADESLPPEACEACGDVGTLLCCDKCPLMYHAECVNLKRIPRGEWLCPKCTKKNDKLKKAQKHPASGSYGTRSNTLTSDTKKSKNHLKTKIGSKSTKRKRYEDSFEEDFEPPPSKRSNRERKTYTDDSEKDENPFKKVYRDSAQNTARRRSKTGSGGDTLDYKACIDLLVELMHHPSSWPFLVPVSKKDAPGYHQIIKRPMDFGTIRSKLNYMNYKNNDDFIRDVYLVLQNCEWFNPKASPEYKAAQVLYKEVKRLLMEYQLCSALLINTISGDLNGS